MSDAFPYHAGNLLFIFSALQPVQVSITDAAFVPKDETYNGTPIRTPMPRSQCIAKPFQPEILMRLNINKSQLAKLAQSNELHNASLLLPAVSTHG